MAIQTWAFGDRVIHSQRPEWGTGVVTAAQSSSHEGHPCQMLTVRFARAGIKNLSTAFAQLKLATDLDQAALDQPALDQADDPPLPVSSSDRSDSSAPASRAARAAAPQPHDPFLAKIRGDVDFKTRMLRIDDSASDPFASPLQRFNATIALYRYSPTGAGLLDWAAVQSGLTDPMSKFNRHELEKFFEQWSIGRDNHLRKVAQELKRADPAALAAAIKAAPSIVQHTLRRLDALR